MKRQSLKDAINEAAKFAEEHRQDDNCCEAEYCASFGYGDGEPELGRLDEATEIQVSILFDRVQDPEKRKEILQECSKPEFIGDYMCRDNEIYSVGLGEIEEQMDDRLAERVKKLSPARFEKLRREVDCYISDRNRDLFYINMDSCRWGLMLDADLLERKLREIPGRTGLRLIRGGVA